MWPIADKSQAREFNGVVERTCVALEQSGRLPRNTFRKSAINTAGGER